MIPIESTSKSEQKNEDYNNKDTDKKQKKLKSKNKKRGGKHLYKSEAKTLRLKNNQDLINEDSNNDSNQKDTYISENNIINENENEIMKVTKINISGKKQKDKKLQKIEILNNQRKKII